MVQSFCNAVYCVESSGPQQEENVPCDFYQEAEIYTENEKSDHPQTLKERGRKKPKKINELELLANLVSDKLNEGCLKGAIRIVSSEETLAAHTEDTAEELRKKHPIRPQSRRSIPQVNIEPVRVTASDFQQAVSFPARSAGGLSGLPPQHL